MPNPYFTVQHWGLTQDGRWQIVADGKMIGDSFGSKETANVVASFLERNFETIKNL